MYELYTNDYKKEIKAMKAFTKEFCKSKKKARAWLVKCGICTPTGRLTKPYR